MSNCPRTSQDCWGMSPNCPKTSQDCLGMSHANLMLHIVLCLIIIGSSEQLLLIISYESVFEG